LASRGWSCRDAGQHGANPGHPGKSGTGGNPNPNINSNLGLTTKVRILGKTNLKTKLYYKPSEEYHHTIEKHHYHQRSKSATRHTQLFISFQKYKSICIGAADVRSAGRQPISHQRGCRRCWNHEKMAGDGTHSNAMGLCIHVLPPPNVPCTEITVKLRRRRYVCRVNATCHKFDNR